MKLRYVIPILIVLLLGCFFWLNTDKTSENSSTESSMQEDSSIVIEESIVDSSVVEESIIEESTTDESSVTSEETSDDLIRYPMGDVESSTDIPEDINPPVVEPNDKFVYYEYYYDPCSQKYERIVLSREWQEYTYQMCLKYNVPYETILGLMGAETGWNVNIGVSDNKLYYGIGMVHIKYNKDNLKKYNIDLCTPAGGIEAVCFIMSKKLYTFGNMDKALIAYNQGNGGARELFSQGIYSTGYSRRVNEIKNGMLQWRADNQIEEDGL